MTKAFVAIHGHFYQPPRENPWLNAIEKEESASPFHDWNERIAFECYRPNAYARIVDGQGKILDLFNNYAYLNFNFGPTLLSWIEKEKPLIYQKILEADRESLRRLGHGNAIAQVFDHLIMPLANERDQKTEVRWGIADFEKHFHRSPEAMWLPETAVNSTTLQILVTHGMRYLILSPFQAARVRPFGSKKWTDVSNGRIDTTQPYRCFLKDESKKKRMDAFIDLFFYDGALSKEIAFGDLLKDGDHFCERFAQVSRKGKKNHQLIHVSTDGETYGHHKKFGEMALAYAFRQGFIKQGMELINYGAYLKKFPPVEEVEIDEGFRGEGTAWSCSHGVGRWKEDCGCSTGGQPGWNQKWRAPLREALNQLRDDLSLLFEDEGEKIFHDPWAARDGYIDVILNRSSQHTDQFFERYGRSGLDTAERLKGLKLLEMQRHALRMFTSCGWFFADLAGLETQLILQHAARAIQYAESFTDQEIEQRFLNILAQARSNDPAKGNGLQIYQTFVKTRQVSLEQVVHHHVLPILFNGEGQHRRIFSFQVETKEQEQLEKEGQRLILGRVNLLSDLVPESKTFLFALFSSPAVMAQNWISEEREGLDFNILKQKGQEGLASGEKALKEYLISLLGNQVYTFRDLLKESRKEIFSQLVEKEIGDPSGVYEEIYHRAKPVMDLLVQEGMAIPYEIRMAVEVTLSHQLSQAIRGLMKDIQSMINRGEIDRILEESKRYGCQLKMEEPLKMLNRIFKEKMEALRNSKSAELPVQETLIQEILALLDHSKRWGIALELLEAQDMMDEILMESIKSLEEALWSFGAPKPIPANLIPLAERLNFNIEKIAKAARFGK